MSVASIAIYKPIDIGMNRCIGRWSRDVDVTIPETVSNVDRHLLPRMAINIFTGSRCIQNILTIFECESECETEYVF